MMDLTCKCGYWPLIKRRKTKRLKGITVHHVPTRFCQRCGRVYMEEEDKLQFKALVQRALERARAGNPINNNHINYIRPRRKRYYDLPAQTVEERRNEGQRVSGSRKSAQKSD
jgi:YgiT-type zinc finger domain-containing protein